MLPWHAVFFDLDHTLFDWPACDAAGRDALSKAGLPVGAYYAGRETIHAQLLHTANAHDIVLRIQKACEITGRPLTEVARLVDVYQKAFESSMRPYPGVFDLFDWLKTHHVKIGIITNSTSRQQLDKMARLGLDVDVFVSSEEAGAEKPAVAPFRLALDKLGCLDSRRVAMVGRGDDVQGARSVGMYAIMVCYHSTRATSVGAQVESLCRLQEWFSILYKDMTMLTELTQRLVLNPSLGPMLIRVMTRGSNNEPMCFQVHNPVDVDAEWELVPWTQDPPMFACQAWLDHPGGDFDNDHHVWMAKEGGVWVSDTTPKHLMVFANCFARSEPWFVCENDVYETAQAFGYEAAVEICPPFCMETLNENKTAEKVRLCGPMVLRWHSLDKDRMDLNARFQTDDTRMVTTPTHRCLVLGHTLAECGAAVRALDRNRLSKKPVLSDEQCVSLLATWGWSCSSVDRRGGCRGRLLERYC